MYVPGFMNVNDPVLPLLLLIDTLKVSVPVFAGAPGHALVVHDVTVCAAELMLVQVTTVPDATVSDSGVKQNVVPPPVHAPEVIVTPAVVAATALDWAAALPGPLASTTPVATTAASAKTPNPSALRRTTVLPALPMLLPPVSPLIRTGRRGRREQPF